MEAQRHQDIPFEQVVENVQPVRSLAHSPLFQVMFAWNNTSEGTFELPGLQTEAVGWGGAGTATFDLMLGLQEADGRIVGLLEYATALFDGATMGRYVGYFRRVLEAMVADERQGVKSLALVGEEERQQVLYEWNRTETAYPKDRCIHELFEEQVRRRPEAVAVVFEGKEMSYGELNRRANRLGHYLRRLGVGPESRVGVYLGRSMELVVALLGVLKAGGGYMPLDPGYPAERLQYMMTDSEPAVVLTQGEYYETSYAFTQTTTSLRSSFVSHGDSLISVTSALRSTRRRLQS